MNRMMYQLYNHQKTPIIETFKQIQLRSGVPDIRFRNRVKRRWSIEEEELLIKAVAKTGEGNWSKMMKEFKFVDRTQVDLKDKWRNMKKKDTDQLHAKLNKALVLLKQDEPAAQDASEEQDDAGEEDNQEEEEEQEEQVFTKPNTRSNSAKKT